MIGAANQEYKVKTAVFEGPLDLLLRLVEERKLFINEISLSQVTDDYLNYIKALQNQSNMEMSDLTAFIVVAATLVLIKSKSLLPGLALTESEQGQIDDLEKRLRFYQAVKTIVPKIKELFGSQIIFSRPDVEWPEAVFAPEPAITAVRMFQAISEVIENIPKKEFLPEVTVRKVINIEEMIGSLIERVQNNLKLSFTEFTRGSNLKDEKEQKVYIIVGFLAMLELVRNGVVNVIQEGNFSDIQIEKQELIIAENI